MKEANRFTKLVTVGLWASLGLLVAQSAIITLFGLSASTLVGVLVFASFMILSISGKYQKDYRFSPYRNFIKNKGS